MCVLACAASVCVCVRVSECVCVRALRVCVCVCVRVSECAACMVSRRERER